MSAPNREALLLRALAHAEGLIAFGPNVPPSWAAGAAARAYAVSLTDLLRLLIDKAHACERARVHVAAMDSADDAERGKP